MTDREAVADVTLEDVRRLRLKQIRALEKIYRELQGIQDRKTHTVISLPILRDKANDLTTLNRRINKNGDILLEKEDQEDRIEEDERVTTEFELKSDQAGQLCGNLVVWKQVTLLIESVEEALQDVEALQAADATTDCSDCLPVIQKQLDETTAHLRESTIPATDALWIDTKALKTRMVRVRAHKRADPRPITVIKSEYDHDFQIPKVNIPKFKGGLESWHAFWSRYKAAVEDNNNLTEPVKMAILIDLVVDHDYLIAANDGGDGRYRQAIDYLKTRFDRPRELHQIYCKQLVDLQPILLSSHRQQIQYLLLWQGLEGVGRLALIALLPL